MKRVVCEFEPEALEAVRQSRWPDRAEAQLRAHVAGCAVCSEVVAVAAALEQSREELAARAIVPDSARVWWRAQLRARREAAEAAGRPITAAQAIAFACAAGLLGACFGAVSTWFQSALRWAASSIASIDFSALAAAAAEHSVLAVAMAAVLLLVPAAVYFAIGRE